MRREMLLSVVVVCCAAAASAQPARPSGAPAGRDDARVDLLRPGHGAVRPGLAGDQMMRAMGAPAVTVDTVGDPDSFGRAKTYLGLAQTLPVFLTADCTVYTPDDGVCIEPNPAPAGTVVDEPDLASIVLPGKATTSIICFTFTPITSWDWSNSTGSPQTAVMFLRPSVKISSDTLIGLTDLDGNPFVDGVLMDTTISTSLESRTLNDGESAYQYSATTRSCIGGLVSARSLREGYGLTDRQIKDFFKNPITLSFGVRGSVAMVTDASYLVGVRLYGD